MNAFKGKIKVGNHRTIERAFAYRDELLNYFYVSLYDKEDAKDLVQLAIIRASRHVDPNLDEREFKKRLFIIARETMFTYFAMKKNDLLFTKSIEPCNYEADDEISLPVYVRHDSRTADDGIDYSMLLSEFRKRLPPRLDRLLDYLLRGYELPQIAQELNRTYYGVNSDLSLLRRMLRQMMKEKGFVVRKRCSEKPHAFSESTRKNPTGGEYA
jgi:DNA-directed RNA polymerase specialized sigma24 family protein